MDSDKTASEPKKSIEPLAIVSLLLWFLGLCGIVVVWLPIDAMEGLEDQTIEAVYVCVGLFAWIPSIACGHVSLSRMRKSTTFKGRGLAYTALTLSYIALSLLILASAFALIVGSGAGK